MKAIWQRLRWLLWAVVLLLCCIAIYFLATSIRPARAHSWYPSECCGVSDFLMTCLSRSVMGAVEKTRQVPEKEMPT
jgi:hypothetical protein